MKVVQLSLDYAPFWHRGGPPRIMYSYARGLSKSGVKVKCICSNHGDESVLSLSELEDGVQVKYIREINNTLLKRFYLNFSILNIWKALDSFYEPGMIIHLAQTRSMFNVVALFYSYFKNVQIAFSPFGSLPNRGIWYLKVFDFFITRHLIRKANFNFGQTSHELCVLSKYGAREGSLKLLPLAFEGIETVSNHKRQKIRSSMGCEDFTKVFLFLGRFHESKGVAELVELFSKTNLSVDIRLWLIGVDDGELERINNVIYAKKLSPYVSIITPKYGRDRFAWYYSADFFVILPKIYEETSLASIESLSVGTPVFTSEKSEIPFLENYNAGVILRNQDCAIDIFNKLYLLSTEELCEMTENSVRLFKDVFMLDKNVLELKEYFMMAKG